MLSSRNIIKFSYGYLWHKSPAATFIFNAYHGMFIFMYQCSLLTNIRWKDLEWHCVRDLWKFEWKSEIRKKLDATETCGLKLIYLFTNSTLSMRIWICSSTVCEFKWQTSLMLIALIYSYCLTYQGKWGMKTY